MSNEISADDMREMARRLTVASVTMGDVNCAAVMLRTLAAEREQQAHGVPEGYALVPIIPTVDMLTAAQKEGNMGHGWGWKSIYMAMIAAAKGEE